MAVNIVCSDGLDYRINRLEHHRNPSGQHNKIKWLLEQSGRDINQIHRIVNSIPMAGYDMISSWIVAEMIAINISKYGYKDRHEYLTALREGKIYNKENK